MARALAFTPRAAAPVATAAVPTPAPAPAANVPDTAGLTQAYAEVRPPAPPPLPVARPVAADGKPFFQAMFTDVRRRGVSQAVNSLWGPAKTEPQPTSQPSALYDLFKDAVPPLRRSQGGKV